MMRIRQLLVRDEGMSVVEVLMACVTSVVILTFVLQTLDSATRTERVQEARHQALVDLRGVMTRITKDVRQAVSVDPSSTPTRLVVRTMMSGVERDATYELSSGRLTRALDAGTAVPLTEGIVTVAPFCYDPPDCALAAPPSLVTSVGVSLSIDPAAFSSEPVSLATEVELRNL